MNNTARLEAVLGTIIVIAFSSCSPLLTNNRETPRNTCINNLRLIDGAKEQWALENDKTGAAVPAWNDVQQYVYGREWQTASNPPLRCPSGGTYILGAVSNAPTCSTPGHALPAPSN